MKKTLMLALLFYVVALKAQISSSRLTLTPNTLVYIVMPDTTSGISKTYMDVYKTYWTFSKYKFITAEERPALSKPGNLFFGFTCYKRKDYNPNKFKDELTYMQVWINLYTYEKEEKKKDGKETYYESTLTSFLLPMNNRNYFDRLIPGSFLMGNSYALDSTAYNMRGSLFLWGPGLLKNYIQKLGLFVKKKTGDEEDSRSSAVDAAKDLAKLKTGTLYIPEYCVYDYVLTTNSYKEDEDRAAKLFEKYPHDYEVISSEKLNQKILNSEEEFFYLVYTNDSPRKYINIISSKTGKIVYSDFSTPGYNFNKNDVKTLIKTLEGG